MGYSEKKEALIERDKALGTTHTIEGKIHQVAVERDKFHPKPASIQTYIPPSIPISIQPIGTDFPNIPVVVGKGAPTSPSPSSPGFIEAHYPKNVPLWAYVVLGCVGCLLGTLIGQANGGAIVGGILGVALGFFSIPIVVIGYHLALRVLAVAVVLFILYLIITHLGK
jgi:hypothetical protein